MTPVATILSPRSPLTQLPSPQDTSVEPSSLPPFALSRQMKSQQELPIRKDLQSYYKYENGFRYTKRDSYINFLTFGATHKTAWHHFGLPDSQRQTVQESGPGTYWCPPAIKRPFKSMQLSPKSVVRSSSGELSGTPTMNLSPGMSWCVWMCGVE